MSPGAVLFGAKFIWIPDGFMLEKDESTFEMAMPVPVKASGFS